MGEKTGNPPIDDCHELYQIKRAQLGESTGESNSYEVPTESDDIPIHLDDYSGI